jgi:hypothetical protein
MKEKSHSTAQHLKDRGLKLVAYYVNPFLKRFRKQFNIPVYSEADNSSFTTTSAKAMKGGVVSKMLNAVYHTAPADKAMPVFLAKCIATGQENLIWRLVQNLRSLATSNEHWKGFLPSDDGKFAAYIDGIKHMMSSPISATPQKLPAGNSALRGLSACPWASAWCYALCLNTSGMGGVTAESEMIKRHIRKHGVKMPLGSTIDDAMLYLDVMGKGLIAVKKGSRNSKGKIAKKDNVLFGGSISDVHRNRLYHSMDMWMAWAQYGALQNPLYDLFYKEAVHLGVNARNKGYLGTAVRLNGTSDFPAHTFKMTNGENLCVALGKAGIVTYDYTKDSARYIAWANSGAWQGYDEGLRNPRMVRGFPSTYYLTFSFSEFNVERSIEILKKGGNVAMAFRMIVGGKVIDPSKQKSMIVKTPFPEYIQVGILSRFPENKNLSVSIIDGDPSDLRFFDRHNWGKVNGGNVIGLRAKQVRYSDYDKQDEAGLMRRFIGKLDERGVIHNPPLGSKPIPTMGKYACTDIDRDILNATGARVGNLIIGGTGEGV